MKSMVNRMLSTAMNVLLASALAKCTRTAHNSFILDYEITKTKQTTPWCMVQHLSEARYGGR
jgi:hypothetical protein